MDSAVIDVAIAIVFLYLTLSLVVSTITEFAARAFRLRSKNLKTGLEELLGKPIATEVLASRLSSTTNNPDHIDPKSFSLALLSVLAAKQPAAEGSPPVQGTLLDRALAGAPANLRPLLDSLVEAGAGKLETVRGEIETWFDTSMTYVAALFRAHTRGITLGAAALVVLLLNADSIMLANIVWRDAATRDAIVAAAGAKIESGAEGAPAAANVQELAKTVEAQIAPFPIGWDLRGEKACETSTQCLGWPASAQDYFLKLLGLIITFLAVSLGAPFWFDVLKRIMRLRTEIDLAKKKMTAGDKA